MIDVSAKIKAAFQSDSMLKRYFLDFPEVKNSETQEVIKKEKIISDTILSDSLTLTEPMCSEEQLHFGCNEAATFEIEFAYEDESVVGRAFNVFLVLGNYTEEEDIFTVGRYFVDTEEVSTDRVSKKITAYDVNYLLNMADVTYWAYTLELPMTVKQIRDSLFAYVNQSQNAVTLPIDDLVIYNNPFLDEQEVLFETVIKGILEFNACFGHIDREGNFAYKNLTPTDNEENYPSKTNYPSATNFPKSIKGKNYYINPHLIKSDITWQNYKCKTVDTVQVRDLSGNVVLENHVEEKQTYTNIYVIENNWIVNALDSESLKTATALFTNAIKNITYTPVDANVKMDLSFEVGDPITLTSTKGNKLPTFIFKRTMTGITSAFDEFEATGYEEWINDPPNTDGAVNELMNDVRNLNDRVSALESGDGALQVISCKQLPEVPQKNVIYLVQGRVTVI